MLKDWRPNTMSRIDRGSDCSLRGVQLGGSVSSKSGGTYPGGDAFASLASTSSCGAMSHAASSRLFATISSTKRFAVRSGHVTHHHTQAPSADSTLKLKRL